jgi:ATP-dependent Clp protease ATP-binding subunit ClpC
MSDRFCPTRPSIPDEARRSRAHNNIVPRTFSSPEEQIENIKGEKNRVVKSQKYEEAAKSATPRRLLRKQPRKAGKRKTKKKR